MTTLSEIRWDEGELRSHVCPLVTGATIRMVPQSGHECPPVDCGYASKGTAKGRRPSRRSLRRRLQLRQAERLSVAVVAERAGSALEPPLLGY